MQRNRIRVVFVTTVYLNVDTGPGTYARHLWKEFRDSPDLEFHLVAPEVGDDHPRLHAAGLGGGSLALYRRVQRLGRVVAGADSDTTVIHGNSTHSMGLLVDYPGPLIVQVNDYESAYAPRNFLGTMAHRAPRAAFSAMWRHRVERRVLARANLAICNSEFTAEVVRQSYGLKAERCGVVHKAVDTGAFRRPLDLPPDPAPDRPKGARLLFVGSDWRRKGLLTLIDAFAMVAAALPEASLTLIGPAPHEPDISRRIHHLGLGGRVHALGKSSREGVAAHLWHADIFVLPSRREAFGVAVLEALAAGVPVVATRAGGIPEIVRPMEEGLLVEPEDPGALAAAIRRLLGDRALRETISLRGPQRAARFSVESMINEIRAVYFSVVAGEPRRC